MMQRVVMQVMHHVMVVQPAAVVTAHAMVMVRMAMRVTRVMPGRSEG
jgi:hypothetical protein